MRKIRTLLFVLYVVLQWSCVAFAGSQQTSLRLASTIITNARAYLNESSASLWTDAELLVWLNDGLLDIVTRSHCMEDHKEIDLCDNQLNYFLVNEMVAVSKVIYSDGSQYIGLTRGTPRDVGHGLDATDSTYGTPQYWYQWADGIFFYPLCNADIIGHTVTVYFVPKPIVIEGSDSIPTPAIYDRALTLFVAGMALFKDGRYGSAMQLIADYQTEMDRLRSQYNIERKEPEDILR